MDANERRRRALSDAAQWWVRLQSQDLSTLERGEFVDWLRESHIHVAELLRIAQVHGALEQFQRWTQIPAALPETRDEANVVRLPVSSQDAPDGSGERAVLPVKRAWPRRRASFVALAASIFVVVLTAGLLQWHARGKVIETERGERREIVLSDGSVVQVDPETRLRVKYVEHERQVYLERGRALFHIAKNPQRPFFVHSDETIVRAVGTAFGVEHSAGSTIVTVAEGKVAVTTDKKARSADSRQPAGEWLNSGNPDTSAVDARAVRRSSYAGTGNGAGGTELPQSAAQSQRSAHGAGSAVPENPASRASAGATDQSEETPVFLTANQQVTVESSGTALPVRSVDSQRELAWAEGRLVFSNDDIAKVVAEFNRYNRVQLTVTDPKLASRPVSGVFNASEPEAFIAFLQSVTAVEVVRAGETSITIAPAVDADK